MGIHIMTPLYEKVIKKVLKEYTETFYPDAHPESTSVDGQVFHQEGSPYLTWAQLTAAAGSSCSDASDYLQVSWYCEPGPGNNIDFLIRSILLFDTSPLGNSAVISQAKLYVYGHEKLDPSDDKPNINVYPSDPASDIVLEAGDFDSLGATPFCDIPIAYDNWSLTDYNIFTLNVAGIAAISKTGVTKLGLRNANYDVAVVKPTWLGGYTTRIVGCAAEKGDDFRPRLTITYRA